MFTELKTFFYILNQIFLHKIRMNESAQRNQQVYDYWERMRVWFSYISIE